MSGEGLSEGAEVEATGETVGEAKWAALRELERRFPGLDKASVQFAVVSEGERGLLGVGHVPARVLASLPSIPRPPGAEAGVPREASGSAAARLRELLEQICFAFGSPAAIQIEEGDSEIVATLSGPGLGLVIGKRGQTIDAIQYLANAVAVRDDPESRKAVVVDAAGYRARRQASLEQQADRAAERALATGSAVALEPMSAAERKIVHLHLKERREVTTESEGLEPNRCVIVRPADGG